jgi:hypothetical protein
LSEAEAKSGVFARADKITVDDEDGEVEYYKATPIPFHFRKLLKLMSDFQQAYKQALYDLRGLVNLATMSGNLERVRGS